MLNITERTYYRWIGLNKAHGTFGDRRVYADHSSPVNKLSAEERQKILDTVKEERFANMPPCEIVPALADEGVYIASESTFYRVLREEKMQNRRGRSTEPGKHSKPTSYTATAPNQVWTWDITYLRGPVKGLFFYLYLIVDIFSRDIVGWEVWPEESAEHASELIQRACIAQKRLSTKPLVLHSDNGSPMKGATMLETLYALGITPSNSRPRVSTDNPYSESLFKTLKYRPNYQPKGFETLEDARDWCKILLTTTLTISALVLKLGMLAYNILRIIGTEAMKKNDMTVRHKTIKRRRIRTVIDRLILIAGHLTVHARKMKLALAEVIPG